ncbi:unnamed protein product [Thelazia callipaeda]|uniref:Uncharacterized protein n=1 Tax=Thelazia callipaeda TaxID=103827 RepID=A0A0N5CPN6_THECL|nr:unnamed protein product [Thelazia callipaeda]
MELATLANQPNSNNQQQLQMQSSNSAATESQNFDGCLQNQTSQTISVTNNTLPSPLTVPSTEVVTTFANDSSTNVNDRNMSEEGYQNSGKSLREMRELDREKLMRYVYFGQAALVIIVALAWIAFTIFDLDSEKANENATRNEFANATQNKSFILPALINNTTNSNRKPLPSVPVDDRISNSTPLKVPLMVNNGIDYPINGDF